MSAPVHATTVAIGGRAVLIEGPSGAGKSDLALRLIDRGALLVSDDYTCLAAVAGTLRASAPAGIAGRMEVRGLGIIEAPSTDTAPVALAVRLGAPDRLPAPSTRVLEGVAVPALVVDAREPSAPIKVELALRVCLKTRERASFSGGTGPLRGPRKVLLCGVPLPHPASHSVPWMGGRVGERAGAAERAMARSLTDSEERSRMTVPPQEVLLVTGMSGAGKSTTLKTLEDLGWETVDNLPLPLLDRLLAAPPPADAGGPQPLALGLGARTRDFAPGRVVARMRALAAEGREVGLLFLDCASAELQRRYAETRRRHPLAPDLPATDGIARERELLAPLRDWANRLVDTTELSANGLAQLVRGTFGREGLGEPTLQVVSFGFSRGLPRAADLVFDMRFLRNPHWVPELRPHTGLDADVAAYVAADPAYEDAVGRIEDLLATLLPRYRAEGKAYVTVAIGCTGGKHRSVHVAERVARVLRERGFSPTVEHRDLRTAPQDALSMRQGGR